MYKGLLWGQHVDEYCDMFALSATDLDTKILDYAAGPGAFNAECARAGRCVVSCSPFLHMSKQQVYMRFEGMIREVTSNKNLFDFGRYGGIDAFIAYRRAGIDDFFNDYAKGKDAARYLSVDAAFAVANFTFDYALCAYSLFSGDTHDSLEFNLHLIRQLARVAKEVRLFPLSDDSGAPSPFLAPTIMALQQENYGVEIREVPYAIQPQSHAMMRVWPLECVL